LDSSTVVEAIDRYGIDPDAEPPWLQWQRFTGTTDAPTWQLLL